MTLECRYCGEPARLVAKPKTSFSEWATNPRTVAMMERDSNQLLEIKRLRAELAAFKAKTGAEQ